MDDWKRLTQFMYADTATGGRFWYADALSEIKGLSEEQLMWLPHPKGLCILWQAGHIACRERLHIGRIQLLRAMLEGKPERAC